MARKSAIEKRDGAPRPEVQRITTAKSANYPAGMMLISSPLEIEGVLRRIPKGRALGMPALREYLARSHAADYSCALTTGIFARIVAEAAEEETALGKKRVTPWWRLVRGDGKLIERFPGGVDEQARRLAAEGVKTERVGKVGQRITQAEKRWWQPE